MLKPKLFTTLKDYRLENFWADLFSGVVVGIIALPLAIAFAIAAGVSPEKGLITAVVAGFLISFLGGSRVQIGGPTGAFVVTIYAIIEKYGMSGLATASVLAGLILILLGLAKWGKLIKFIPHPVIVGFTSGIAVIIFSTQIKDFLGLRIQHLPVRWLEQWAAYQNSFFTLNLDALGIGLLTLIILVLWQKYFKKIPGSLVAIGVSTLLVAWLRLPVETIGTRFGQMPSVHWLPLWPSFDFANISLLIGPAFTLAMLAGIESLLSASVADGMIGGRHRSNMELVAQGVANMVTPFFGGIPATGAIARTVANIKNGGRTPVAGMVHALTLALLMIFFSKWVTLIPLACLAGILIMIAYNMSEWRSAVAIFKTQFSDALVLVATFSITILFDLTLAIEVGIVLASLLFMQRMAGLTHIDPLTQEWDEEVEEVDALRIGKKNIPAGVDIFEINGAFFFGAATQFEETLHALERYPKVLIIHMHHVSLIDSTGLHVLERVHRQCHRYHTLLILSGVHALALRAIKQFGLLTIIGRKNIFLGLNKAILRAERFLSEKSL